MMGRSARLLAGLLVLSVCWPMTSRSQTEQPAQAVDAFTTEQLDALLAPIALYPDTLLIQILMASTFPVQIVEASRWLEQPDNKGLTGDALANALETQSWDPSVKALVPFPQVLAMLNDNLDWTQQLGYAFADQQDAVMDAVQRLRNQAQASGSLQSNAQQVVDTGQQAIVIQPAQPDVVYVPIYNPNVVYGAWPYPTYPPVYLSPPAGYAVGTAVAIIVPLWGWARPVWRDRDRHGHVEVDVDRYNHINIHRAAIQSNVWQPNRAGGRPAGLQGPPGGPVGRPAWPSGLPAAATGRPQVSLPGNVVMLPVRPAFPQQRPVLVRPAIPPNVVRPVNPPTVGNRPNSNQRPLSPG
jgi:hypothetical protein